MLLDFAAVLVDELGRVATRFVVAAVLSVAIRGTLVVERDLVGR